MQMAVQVKLEVHSQIVLFHVHVRKLYSLTVRIIQALQQHHLPMGENASALDESRIRTSSCLLDKRALAQAELAIISAHDKCFLSSQSKTFHWNLYTLVYCRPTE